MTRSRTRLRGTLLLLYMVGTSHVCMEFFVAGSDQSSVQNDFINRWNFVTKDCAYSSVVSINQQGTISFIIPSLLCRRCRQATVTWFNPHLHVNYAFTLCHSFPSLRHIIIVMIFITSFHVHYNCGQWYKWIESIAIINSYFGYTLQGFALTLKGSYTLY